MASHNSKFRLCIIRSRRHNRAQAKSRRNWRARASYLRWGTTNSSWIISGVLQGSLLTMIILGSRSSATTVSKRQERSRPKCCLRAYSRRSMASPQSSCLRSTAKSTNMLGNRCGRSAKVSIQLSDRPRCQATSTSRLIRASRFSISLKNEPIHLVMVARPTRHSSLVWTLSSNLTSTRVANRLINIWTTRSALRMSVTAFMMLSIPVVLALTILETHKMDCLVALIAQLRLCTVRPLLTRSSQIQNKPRRLSRVPSEAVTSLVVKNPILLKVQALKEYHKSLTCRTWLSSSINSSCKRTRTKRICRVGSTRPPLKTTSTISSRRWCSLTCTKYPRCSRR